MHATDAEFQSRWAQAHAESRARGLDALLVWSRGGATVDAYADVLYLSNHYSPFPLVSDILPHWSARAHSALVLPNGEEPTLVVDIPDWRRDLVAVEDVRFALDLPAAVTDVLRKKHLHAGRLGLVGGNAMHAAPYRRLVSMLPDADLADADDLVERLRLVKSTFELDALRAAAEVGNTVVGAMIDAALRPGSTEAEAVAAGYGIATARGLATYDAAVASGPFSDHYAYGRLPSWTTRTLERGDFFHVDTYAALDGYLYDFARCCVVGGSPSAAQIEVLDAVVDAVEAGVSVIRPGVAAGDVYTAVHNVLETRGMTPGSQPRDSKDDRIVSALTTSFPAHGHSFGMGWERPWLTPSEGEVIKANTCFGIEAMAGRHGVGSAKFEHDVLVLDDRTELLTTLPSRYW